MYHRKIEVQFLYLVHAGPNLMDSNPIHATSRYTTVQVCILLPIALALRPYQIWQKLQSPRVTITRPHFYNRQLTCLRTHLSHAPSAKYLEYLTTCAVISRLCMLFHHRNHIPMKSPKGTKSKTSLWICCMFSSQFTGRPQVQLYVGSHWFPTSVRPNSSLSWPLEQ